MPQTVLATTLRAAIALALAATGTVALAAGSEASTAGDAVVISEVYGGGGNTGAPYLNDFVELYNPTDHAISLTGMSVQYRSSSGTLGGVTPLSGSVPAGKHWLVQGAVGSGNGVALPPPDATGTLAMSATNGIVVLAQSTFAVPPSDPSVLDLVGYGTASAFETAAAPALSNTTSASRNAV